MKRKQSFTKKISSLPDDLEKLFESLKINPLKGASLGNDCYKIRLAIKSKGKGKSGGARVITYVRIALNKILLISIYDKSVKSTVTDKEIRSLLKNIPDTE